MFNSVITWSFGKSGQCEWSSKFCHEHFVYKPSFSATVALDENGKYESGQVYTLSKELDEEVAQLHLPKPESS